MAPKHPYTDEASKGEFLALLENGESIPSAAKKIKINIKTARDIKKRADKITNVSKKNLPDPDFSYVIYLNLSFIIFPFIILNTIFLY
jgi:hypothetical protein